MTKSDNTSVVKAIHAMRLMQQRIDSKVYVFMQRP